MKLEPLNVGHLDELLPFVEEYHAFDGIHMPEGARRRVLARLLGSPELGSVWALATAGGWIGYLALTYGFSIEFQGRDAFIDELFIRASHRRRGFGSRALTQARERAAALGLVALHLEVGRDNQVARKLYGGLGFEPRDRFSLMSLRLGQAGTCTDASGARPGQE